jgi:hypothetical protein
VKAVQSFAICGRGSDEEITMADNGMSEAKRTARFARWETLGLDRVKDDLRNGGHRLVGGGPAVRELAWEWVRKKEQEQVERDDAKRNEIERNQSKPSSSDVLLLKPAIWGVGIDLRALWKKLKRR